MTAPAAKLLDVNFLVALAWPNHVTRPKAVSWFMANRDTPSATCPLTEVGFVGVSMNPLVVTEQLRCAAALRMLDTYRIRYRHLFWPDPLPLAEALGRLEPLPGHRQVIDAHLLGLDIDKGGRLVCFDRGIAAITPEHDRDRLLVAEV